MLDRWGAMKIFKKYTVWGRTREGYQFPRPLQKMSDAESEYESEMSEHESEVEVLDTDTLVLDDADLEEISYEVLEMAELKTLTIKGADRLLVLPDDFDALRSLESLTIKDCGLATLNECVATMDTLTALHLPYNALSFLPDTFADMSNLASLDISGNSFVEFPSAIFRLKHLTTLKYSRNQLASVPDALCDLRDLRHLDLSYSLFEHLPRKIYQLSHLEELLIHGCGNLRTLPLGVSLLSQLQLLTMGGSTEKLQFPKASLLELDMTSTIPEEEVLRAERQAAEAAAMEAGEGETENAENANENAADTTTKMIAPVAPQPVLNIAAFVALVKSMDVDPTTCDEDPLCPSDPIWKALRGGENSENGENGENGENSTVPVKKNCYELYMTGCLAARKRPIDAVLSLLGPLVPKEQPLQRTAEIGVQAGDEELNEDDAAALEAHIAQDEDEEAGGDDEYAGMEAGEAKPVLSTCRLPMKPLPPFHRQAFLASAMLSPSIVSLELKQCVVDPFLLQRLCGWVIQSGRVQHVALDYLSPLPRLEDGVLSLLEAETSPVLSLSLRGMQMSRKSGRLPALLRAVGKNSNSNSRLTALNLGGNRINEEGVELIAKCLSDNTSLKALSLGSNPVGLRGLRLLSDTLGMSPLSEEEGAKLLAAKKAEVEAENNRIEAAQKAAKKKPDPSLPEPVDVETLTVGDCPGVETINGAFFKQGNRSLISLDLSFVEAGDAGARIVSQLLQSNHALQRIKFSGNKVSPVCQAEIESSLLDADAESPVPPPVEDGEAPIPSRPGSSAVERHAVPGAPIWSPPGRIDWH